MNSNNNRSPPLRTGEICTISPIGLSPDEMIATLEQDRSVAPGLNTNAARRGFVHRITRRTVWWPLRLAAFLVVVAPLLVTAQSEAQVSHQGSKLVGTFAVGPAYQGSSVALSADGNTAIVGGLMDNKLNGAVWAFTRNGTAWTQQGSKLVGTGAVGNALGQGISVALSADGNTAIVGGAGDNAYTGAAWVFTRSGTVWTQQGSKLVGTGVIGKASQAHSVALSADGNTAIISGPRDNSSSGAEWVFTRSGTVWTQQGSKLVGAGAVGNARQGSSLALSADGNTVIVGGISDNMMSGAAWVHSRSGTVWTQQHLGF